MTNSFPWDTEAWGPQLSRRILSEAVSSPQTREPPCDKMDLKEQSHEIKTFGKGPIGKSLLPTISWVSQHNWD